jgi:hypothetical protein
VVLAAGSNVRQIYPGIEPQHIRGSGDFHDRVAPHSAVKKIGIRAFPAPQQIIAKVSS